MSKLLAAVLSTGLYLAFLKLLGQVAVREPVAISHNPIYTQPERIGRMFSQGDA